MRWPLGVNVAYSDGHAEHNSDQALATYAHVALPVYGITHRFVMVAWEYLDGDPRRIESFSFYWLPPEFFE